MNINRYIYFLYLPLLLIIFSCGNTDETQQEESVSEMTSDTISISEQQFTASGFKLGTITEQTFTTNLNVNGMIELPQKSKSIISTYIGGIVSGMNVIHGQWVQKGQVLFQLTNPELIKLQQDYLELAGKINYLAEEFERQKILSAENISAKKDYLKAESELNIAKAQIAGVTAQLELIGIKTGEITSEKLTSSLPITAPTSGYISLLNIINGGFLDASSAAMEISNTSHMHIELSILEKDIALLTKGQKINYSLQNNPDKKFLGEVFLIEQQVSDNRLINVHCHIEKPFPANISPGMFVTATVETASIISFALPEDAVVAMDGKHFVLVKVRDDGYQFKKKLVTAGITEDGFTQLLNDADLDPGANYLTKGAYYMILGE